MIRATRETWVIFTIVTLNSVGWSASMPFLAVYLSAVRDVSLLTIGVVYFVAGLLSIASQIVGGRLTDSAGPKRVMLVGYAFSILSALVLSYLIGANGDTDLILVAYPAFNFLRGVATPASAAVVANSEIEDLPTGLSLLSVAGNLGFAIGPALGGILAQTVSYSSIFLFSAAVPAVTAVLAARFIQGGLLKQRDITEQARTSAALKWRSDRNLILFILLTLCGYLAIGYEIAPISLYVQKFLSFSSEEIGYIFATNGLVIVILQLPLSRLFFRMRRLVYPIIASCCLAALSFVVGGQSTTFLEWEGTMVILTLGEIFLTVPSQSIITMFSSARTRGTFQGYYSGAAMGGRSLSSLVGLYSFQFFAADPRMGWYAIAGFSVVLALCFYLLAEPLQKDFRALGREEMF